MYGCRDLWGVVLAAGDGTRLQTLTRDERGAAVPKQFCSLRGGGSLLQDAIDRARHVVPRDRIAAVVAAAHRRWWQGALWSLAQDNVFVQPGNRGTAIGVALATLSIAARDPFARILLLPADHYVHDEHRMAAALREAAFVVDREDDVLALVGIEPETLDPELGYVLPDGDARLRVSGVRRFVEKPAVPLARELVAAGALWNSFILAGRATTFISLLRDRRPDVIEDIATAIARDAHAIRPLGAVDELYRSLPTLDFSRDVLAGAEERLRVVAAIGCGWSDLGTPQRVAETLRRYPAAVDPPVTRSHGGFVNLAARHAAVAAVG